jgi:hypothetical protein
MLSSSSEVIKNVEAVAFVTPLATIRSEYLPQITTIRGSSRRNEGRALAFSTAIQICPAA